MTNIQNIIAKHTGAKFDFEEREREFISLADFVKKHGEGATRIDAMFINKKSKFGDAPVFYTTDYMINMPKHLTPLVTDLRQDNDVVDAINKGQLGFESYEYEGINGDGYSINLVEIEDKTKGRAFDNVNDDGLPFD